MFRNRLTRVLTLLVLILAQAALARPHVLMGASAQAHVQAAGGMAHENCQHDTGTPSGGTSHSNAPTAPCSSCPASMPGQQGGSCLDMASCGPSSASAGAPPVAVLSAISVCDIPPSMSSPSTCDFVPDPPPPRA